jgi:bifunctional DNA-binding transcriptional regulator/antitoxin component of YhaV-PrlF toxin-antitoxin module
MKKWFILAGLLISFIAAAFDIMAGIYLCVLTNGFSNWIMLCRQKSKTTITRVKKKRPMTVDEFRQAEMEANPHRPYPRHDDDVYK